MKVKATERFKVERASKGITIRELSELAAVPIGTISRLENGQSVSVRSASKLSKAMKQEFEKLFYIEAAQ